MVCLQYYTYSSVSWKGYILSQVALIRLLWLSCFILNSARVVISSPLDYMASLLPSSSTTLILVLPEKVIFIWLPIRVCFLLLCVYILSLWFLPLLPSVLFLFWCSWKGPRWMIFCPGFLLSMSLVEFPAQFLAVTYTIFQFSIKLGFYSFCIDYDFSLCSILLLYFY